MVGTSRARAGGERCGNTPVFAVAPSNSGIEVVAVGIFLPNNGIEVVVAVGIFLPNNGIKVKIS